MPWPLPLRGRTRVVLLLAATAVILGVVLLVAGRRGADAGFATPADCLDAYRDSLLDGDEVRYRQCLIPALRADGRARFEAARQELRAAGHWSQFPADITDDTATILVDQVRQDGMIHRVPYRLERSPAGWLLADVGRPEVIRPPVRPGTHVGDR